MINTIYLQTFLAVVDTGSYTAAAEQLHMSQPAVSQHIRTLEDQLDHVRLFRRIGQRMVPTHAGEQLLVVARDMVMLAERAAQNIKALKGQVAGRVVIGCTSNNCDYLLPQLFAAFRKQFPSVSLAVQLAPAKVLLNALMNHQITMVLIEEQLNRRGIESYLLGSEELLVLVPHDHALTEHEAISLTLLRKQPLILPGSGLPLRRTIEDGLRRQGVAMSDIDVVFETDSMSMLLQSIREGIGIAFVPRTRIPAGDDLVAIQLTNMQISQEWYMLRVRDDVAPRAAQEFYHFLMSVDTAVMLAKQGLQRGHEG
ncbi:MAG: LysR family transcriptional regulator [Chloroflexaceae bacterium]|nr:LysR family transcriptional regulator [Chloroflexaceae bacterium]